MKIGRGFILAVIIALIALVFILYIEDDNEKQNHTTSQYLSSNENEKPGRASLKEMKDNWDSMIETLGRPSQNP